MTRLLISQLNKAILNNQKVLIIPLSYKINQTVLKLLQLNGFVQAIEVRGNFLILHLKQIYWKSWGISCNAIKQITSPKVRRHTSIRYKTWQKWNKLTGTAVVHIISTDKGVHDIHTSNAKSGGFPLLSAY